MPAYSVVKRVAMLGLWLILPLYGQADTRFQVEQAQIYRIGNGYIVNAQLAYPLTPRVEEALNNGVPITFFQEIQLIDRTALIPDWWIWNTVLWSTKLRYELRYHDLSEQYLLYTPDSPTHRNHPTLGSALDTMGGITNLTLPPDITRLQRDHNLVLRLRTGIDLMALPSPMRPGAMISSKWDLTSPWYEAIWPSD
ncbi:DUF4390 domain-containing protein [Methylophaga frappieri]|nr:DUF4390 domain-containing protein [Methylophaga frappieri]